MLEAFFASTAVVALAEIGDKTMLLAIVLAARLRAPWAILAGILVATLANHALAALVGSQVAGLLDAPWPPVYPKQPLEPPRVAPSRARKD